MFEIISKSTICKTKIKINCLSIWKLLQFLSKKPYLMSLSSSFDYNRMRAIRTIAKKKSNGCLVVVIDCNHSITYALMFYPSRRYQALTFWVFLHWMCHHFCQKLLMYLMYNLPVKLLTLNFYFSCLRLCCSNPEWLVSNWSFMPSNWHSFHHGLCGNLMTAWALLVQILPPTPSIWSDNISINYLTEICRATSRRTPSSPPRVNKELTLLFFWI